MQTSAKVAVIGLGPLGLVTLKNLIEEGFDATGFDKADVVGGLWNFKDDNQTTVLESTVSNASKQRGCFTDFPYSPDTPTYPKASHVQKYLCDYARHFNLASRTRLNTEVLGVQRDEASAKWKVETAPAQGEGYGTNSNKTSNVECFDKVVFATGVSQRPVMPDIEGLEIFEGKVLHSSGYKRPASFEGKTVLIVGFSNSAADTATTLASHAKQIYISRRHDVFVVPRFVNGRPLDHGLNYRKASILRAIKTCLPGTTVNNIMRRALTATHQKGCPGPPGQLDLDLTTAPLPDRVSPIVSDSILQEVLAGRVELVRGLCRVVGPHSVLLDDGRQLDGIDALVFCTGYQADYSLAGAYDPTREQLPAWTAAAGSNKRRLPRLYRNIFSLELPQCLAFIGCISFLNPAFELYDLASMALAQVWAGKARLPSRADMAASVDAQQAHLICLAEDGIGSVTPCWVDRDEWMAWAEETAGTGVGAHLGYGYAGWSFWIQDRHLCRILMDGIPSPHVYRHFETGRRRAWQGARDEILRINEKEI